MARKSDDELTTIRELKQTKKKTTNEQFITQYFLYTLSNLRLLRTQMTSFSTGLHLKCHSNETIPTI